MRRGSTPGSVRPPGTGLARRQIRGLRHVALMAKTADGSTTPAPAPALAPLRYLAERGTPAPSPCGHFPLRCEPAPLNRADGAMQGRGVQPPPVNAQDAAAGQAVPPPPIRRPWEGTGSRPRDATKPRYDVGGGLDRSPRPRGVARRCAGRRFAPWRSASRHVRCHPIGCPQRRGEARARGQRRGKTSPGAALTGHAATVGAAVSRRCGRERRRGSGGKGR